jgi:hypothetical protein
MTRAEYCHPDCYPDCHPDPYPDCHPERGLIFAPSAKIQPQSKDPYPLNISPSVSTARTEIFQRKFQAAILRMLVVSDGEGDIQGIAGE